MKIIHAADLHIDSPLTGLVRYEGAPIEQIRSATRRATEGLVQLCLDERAELLLLAGDLFDGDWKDYTTGLFFIRQMLRLKQAETQVVIVRGNHDAASVISKQLPLPENVYELGIHAPETKIFEELGTAVHGQSYARRAELSDLAADYPDAAPGYLNIGLLHTSLNGRVGHENYAPTALSTLLSKGYDYWALGHVHEREVLCRAPWVVFPGNLQGRHIHETGPKGASVLDVSDRQITDVSHRELDVVRFCSLKVTAKPDDDPEAVLALATRLVEGEQAGIGSRLLACRVVIDGQCAAHAAFQQEPERWENELRARLSEFENVWLERTKFRTRAPYNTAKLCERGDALGQVARRLSALSEDPQQLEEFLPLFEGLHNKLPSELRDRTGGLHLDETATLTAALDDVESLVLTRLMELSEQ